MKAIHFLPILISTAVALPCSAQTFYADSVERAVQFAARPEKKIRTLGHEWVWELEQAGVYNRARPRQLRVGLPLMTLGDSGPDVIATYTSPAGISGERRWMFFVYVPLE